VWRPSLCSA